MSLNEIVKSEQFGGWSRLFFAYMVSSIVGIVVASWIVSGYSHDLSNEIAGLHHDSKETSRKLDSILGVPGESIGLLPEIRNEQTRVKDSLIQETQARANLATSIGETNGKLEKLIQQTGENNPLLKQLNRQLNLPHGGAQ